jgi:hypothetical protein
MRHIHRWVSDLGVDEFTCSAEEFDRRWLQQQRLVEDTGSVTVGYLPTPGEEVTRIGSVQYAGYIYEDTSGCPVCEGQP